MYERAQMQLAVLTIPELRLLAEDCGMKPYHNPAGDGWADRPWSRQLLLESLALHLNGIIAVAKGRLAAAPQADRPPPYTREHVITRMRAGSVPPAPA